jgi:hypothetical protein
MELAWCGEGHEGAGMLCGLYVELLNKGWINESDNQENPCWRKKFRISLTCVISRPGIKNDHLGAIGRLGRDEGQGLSPGLAQYQKSRGRRASREGWEE